MKLLRSLVICVAVCLLATLNCSAGARIQTVQFQSKLVGVTLPYDVILPPTYDNSPTTRYPVLYLLHGLTGHYVDWVTRTNVADYAARYSMIVVTPEANDSWYSDSATNDKEKYETYILKELIPDVQQRYRTIEARYGRAIAGLSMGGYGAIKFGLKAPASFVFAASMSGAFGVTRFSENEVNASGWQASLQLFGPVGSETRKANDVFELISALPASRIPALPYFYFDCGTEDSRLILPYNRELASLMLEKKIPHEFRQLPGDHSWGYWDRQVQVVLRIASEKMRLPRPVAMTRKPSRKTLA
jgi:S-formylglutathione hydrolase FrmB